MYMMKGSVKGEVIRRILELSLVSEVPLRLTEQVEWHEFTPLGFLLVQSLRPQRILEVGTTIGDSYLSFCQAVQVCNLSAECICVPRSKDSRHDESDSNQLEEFRTYHDALYSGFSEIEMTGVRRRQMAEDLYKFDLVHIVSPQTAGELEKTCSTWLPKLNFSGAALISGRGRFDQSGLKRTLNEACLRYCIRILQMENWVAILSKQPVGIVRDLLLSSDDEFFPVAKLLNLLGDRVRSQQISQRAVGSLRSYVEDLSLQLVAKEESRVELLNTQRQLRSDAEDLTTRLAATEESEIEAQFRFAQTAMRLDSVWLEKEELSKKLHFSEDGTGTPTEDKRLTPTPGDGRLFAGVKAMLLQLLHQYSGEYESPSSGGRDFWDDCGRSVLASIFAKQTRLTYPRPIQPLVSVIVVVRNNIHLSVLCLCALRLITGVDYELIIIDNGSSDETSELLSLIDSATVIRNAGNRGFGPAAMQGAARASGKFLCFLNNDALLPRGSLASSLDVFAERPVTGAVGGNVRLADGRLQEAGFFIWRDGRTLQFGRGDDPCLPQYCFRRPVDYCSGAFLVTPRLLFQSVDGLDDRYAPAYYEDADYCMKLWNANRPVIYEPRAVIHHYEGASSTSSAATRELVMVNHKEFTDRWRVALGAHRAERAENIVRARIAAQSRSPKCLYFLGELPDELSSQYMDSRLQHIRALVRDGHLVTCLVTGNAGRAYAGGSFPVDVEIRALDSMGIEEVSQYCESSDLIVVATSHETNLRIGRTLDEYSAKVMRVHGAQ